MPLHDWSEPAGWDGLHDVWIVELLRHIQPKLPAGYRAYIGSTPALAVGAPKERPDVAVRQWTPYPPAEPFAAGELGEADEEVAVMDLDPQSAVYVTTQGRMIAAVELVSPGNKDRPQKRDYYLGRYLGYLREGAHLLLVDVHRKPAGFSFADAITAELRMDRPGLPCPHAVAYRSGELADGVRLLGMWRRRLAVGEALPTMPLPLGQKAGIHVDLEATYMRAAADLYLT